MLVALIGLGAASQLALARRISADATMLPIASFGNRAAPPVGGSTRTLRPAASADRMTAASSLDRLKSTQC